MMTSPPMRILAILSVVLTANCVTGNESEGFSVSLSRLEVPITDRPHGTIRSGAHRMAALQVPEELTNYRNVYYYGEVRLGTPGENLRVMFDTGSPSMWVYSGCGLSSWLCLPCWAHRTYHHCRSLTYQPKNDPVYIGYLSAYVNGYTSRDILRIGRASAWVTVAEATSGPFLNSLDEEFDGIMGLAPCAGPTCPINRGLPPPVIHSILSAMKNDTFSVYLDRTGRGSGVLTFGGTDKSYYEEGTLRMHPTSSPYTWKIRIDSVWVGNRMVLNYTRSRMEAYVDTGTTLIIGPPTHVRIVLSALGIRYSQQVPCERTKSLPNLSFVIGGVKYTLRPQQYASVRERTVGGRELCLTGLEGQMVGAGDWILGDNFLGAFYTVFRTANGRASRIGFANIKSAAAG